MQGQLVFRPQGRQQGECDAGPGAPVEPVVARPQRTPRRLGEVALEVGIDLGGPGDGAVDVFVAEHLAAHPHAGVVAVVGHRAGSPSRWAPSRALTSSARSQLARWAASRISIRAPGISVAIELAVLRRRGGIHGSGDHERRRGDAREVVTEIHLGDRLAEAA